MHCNLQWEMRLCSLRFLKSSAFNLHVLHLSMCTLGLGKQNVHGFQNGAKFDNINQKKIQMKPKLSKHDNYAHVTIVKVKMRGWQESTEGYTED